MNIILLLGVAWGVVQLFAEPTSTGNETPVPTVSSQAELPEVVEEDVEKPLDEAPKQEEAPVEEETEPVVKKPAVQLIVRPSSAQIFEGPKRLGQGEVTIEFDSESSKGKKLVIRETDHLTKVVLLKPSHAPILRVELEKERRNARAQPKTPPPLRQRRTRKIDPNDLLLR